MLKKLRSWYAKYLFLAGCIGSMALAVHCERQEDVRAVISPRRLLLATEKVESDGDLWAIGNKVDKKGRPRPLSQWTYGPLQIKQILCDDLNQLYGARHEAKKLLGDRATSVAIRNLYLSHYATKKRLGHEPTAEDMARIWYAGPRGCFDGGAINRYGDLLKEKKKGDRADLAYRQAEAKRYWLRVKRAVERLD